jgi:hypothetical protein
MLTLNLSNLAKMVYYMDKKRVLEMNLSKMPNLSLKNIFFNIIKEITGRKIIICDCIDKNI